MVFVMQLACESRTRKALRDAQAARDAQFARYAQAACAANADMPRVESGSVQAVLLIACIVLYILYKLARTCYRSIMQFLHERGLALQVAQVQADLVAERGGILRAARQPGLAANVNNPAAAAEERLAANVDNSTAAAEEQNNPTAAEEERLAANESSPTAAADEAAQDAPKKRASTNSAANDPTGKK